MPVIGPCTGAGGHTRLGKGLRLCIGQNSGSAGWRPLFGEAIRSTTLVLPPLVPLLHRPTSARHGTRGGRPAVACPANPFEGGDDGSTAPSPSTPPPLALPVRLNSTPTPRPVRAFFYDDAADGVCAALAAGRTRLCVKVTLPETDRTFDSYRLATVLECVRVAVMRLSDQGRAVRVCVQGPLGEGFFTGMPLSLAGAGRMIQQMDWGRTPEQEAAVSFGDVGAGAVEAGVDVYFVIAPQNMAGACVTAPLEAMAAAVGAAGAAMVLVNPSLADVQSSGGLMSVRGREARLAFEASFAPAYVFRLLFTNPSIPYPILGALRFSYGQSWQVWSREEAAAHVEGREVYYLAGETGPEPPSPAELTSILRTRRLAVERMEREVEAASRRLAAREGGGGGERRAWWEWW